MPDAGPYLNDKPLAFLIDGNGYAWALWEGDRMSMVASTTANESPDPWHVYSPMAVLAGEAACTEVLG